MSFWSELQGNAKAIHDEWAALWPTVGTKPLTPSEARHILDVVWKRSHLDILQHIPEYKQFYPTKQGNTGRLKGVRNLWWVDHATAGINGWGTLGWFSSKQRSHARAFASEAEAKAYALGRQGKVTAKGDKWVVTWTGYAGACTHFVVMMDGTPFYIVNLDDGCWGEPQRNGDGIHVELVNPLVVTRKKDQWCFWAGPIPKKITDVLHPSELDKPFRGVSRMLPYTWNQVVTNIKLKRLCVAATQDDQGARMSRDRMSQHTDWRASKFDMGPLWPFKLCNDAAFENYPIEDYDFMKQFVRAVGMDDEASMEEVLKATLREPAENPNVEHDLWDSDESITSIKDLQKALILLYGPAALPKYGADGSAGQETTTAVRRFQENWNRVQPKDRITVDGIPGVQTMGRLERALLMHSNHTFVTT